MRELDTITGKILENAYKVHSALGPGLLESAYSACLYFELVQTGIKVQREKGLPLIYKEVKLDCGYRMDLWVEQKVVVEVKSVEALSDLHLAQILTYLRLSNSKVGLLLNFNVLSLKSGIKRVVNGL